jgi:hydroxypyruvate isomerase
MVSFAANLTYLFRELPFLDRFEQARCLGFQAVEFQFPYERRPQDIKSAMHDTGLKVIQTG